MSSRSKGGGGGGLGGARRDAVIAQVAPLAAMYGVQWFHPRPGRTVKGWRTPVQGPGGAGYPDLTLWGPGGFALRECKGNSGSLSPVQRQRHAELAAAGVDVGVWRPRDVISGRVVAELRALAGRGGTVVGVQQQFVTEPCRSCGAEVIWCQTAGGRAQPVDSEPAVGGYLAVDPDPGGGKPWARRVAAQFAFGRRDLRYAHHHTCPHGRAWKRR